MVSSVVCSLALLSKRTHRLLYSIWKAIVSLVPILPLKSPGTQSVLLLAIKIKVPYRLELGKQSLIKLGHFYFVLQGRQCALVNQAVVKWTGFLVPTATLRAVFSKLFHFSQMT